MSAPPATDAAPKPRGPPPEQMERTLAWISACFREHYRQNPPDLPPRFGKREFGFMWIAKKFFLRHKAIRGREELLRQLLDSNPQWGTPHHCYYSTAYYKDPGASTMKEKGWLGADLIFDLDADHLPNAHELSYTQQLEEVRKQTRWLLEEFVLGDLGFDADNVRLVFSGGRGYHIHVHDPRVLQMDANARREVVDYATARGVIVDGFVKEHTASVRRGYQGRREKETYLIVPRPSDPGWAGRWSRRLIETLQTLSTMESPRQVMRWAKARGLQGVGEKRAHELLELSKRREASGLTQIELIGQGRVSNKYLMNVVDVRQDAVQGLNESIIKDEKGESDEPVTADIKRLIRLPGSLHGKTGFRVTPVDVDGLKDFDPLRDAVAFDETPVKVIVSKPEGIRLGETDHACEPGPQELPLRYAMFLTLRRGALLPLKDTVA